MVTVTELLTLIRVNLKYGRLRECTFVVQDRHFRMVEPICQLT